MSAAKDSDTRPAERVYVRLLGEGVPVLRPTNAVRVGKMVFHLLPIDNFDQSDEIWEFPPGSVVRCTTKESEGTLILVAETLAEPE